MNQQQAPLPNPSENQITWLFTRARRVVAEHMGVSDNDISRDTNFRDDLGADSLDLIEMVMALEDEFTVEIPDSDADQMVSSNAALQILHKHLSKHQGQMGSRYRALA